jgi:ureidoacrylate peracid hydrolase
MAGKALILVDMENEWADKNSEYYVGNTAELIRNTNKLIDFCREKGCRIIFVRHFEKGSTTIFAEGTSNAEIFPGLHREKQDAVITKHKVSAFYQNTLGNELKEIRHIVICGILTNQCVRMLAEEAYDREFSITIVPDCCMAFDRKTHEFTLKDLKETREEIEIIKLAEFVKKKKRD